MRELAIPKSPAKLLIFTSIAFVYLVHLYYKPFHPFPFLILVTVIPTLPGLENTVLNAFSQPQKRGT